MVVDKSKIINFNLSTGLIQNFFFKSTDTAVSEIEDCFKRFIKRDDIDIILINQNCAELIRHVIDAHTSPVPAILEIPSKGSYSCIFKGCLRYLIMFVTF